MFVDMEAMLKAQDFKYSPDELIGLAKEFLNQRSFTAQGDMMCDTTFEVRGLLTRPSRLLPRSIKSRKPPSLLLSGGVHIWVLQFLGPVVGPLDKKSYLSAISAFDGEVLRVTLSVPASKE